MAAKVKKDLSAWREILAASEDAVTLAEMIQCFAEHHPDRVDANTPEIFSCAMTGMLTATFSIESLVNDVLQSVTRNEIGHRWEDEWAIREKLPLKDKIRRICVVLGLDSPLGTKDFQLIDDMLDFRRRIVHAKPETIEATLPADQAFNGKAWDHISLKAKWEQDCTIENAVRFRDAAWAIANWFIENTGYGPNIATMQVWV